MNYKLNVNGLEVKIPESTMNPEINVDFKGMSVEMENLSLPEYASFMKEMFSLGKDFAKDILLFQNEMQQRNDELMRKRLQSSSEIFGNKE